MSANEVPDAVLTEVGNVTGYDDDGTPVIDPTNARVSLVIGIEGDYEAGRLAGIREGSQLADNEVAQLLSIISGDIQVYRSLLDVADDEIAWLAHCDKCSDEMIDTLFKYIERLERRIKKLRRQGKRAYDEGFRAALTLAPGEGSGTADLEQALITGSQDPEFAAARTEHANQTA